MADLLLRDWIPVSIPGLSCLTESQQQAVDRVLLAIASGSEKSPAAQGVTRVARALKTARDDQIRAVRACDPDAAAAAAQRAQEAEAALVRAVARMAKDESKPKHRQPILQSWTKVAFG